MTSKLTNTSFTLYTDWRTGKLSIISTDIFQRDMTKDYIAIAYGPIHILEKWLALTASVVESRYPYFAIPGIVSGTTPTEKIEAIYQFISHIKDKIFAARGRSRKVKLAIDTEYVKSRHCKKNG